MWPKLSSNKQIQGKFLHWSSGTEPGDISAVIVCVSLPDMKLTDLPVYCITFIYVHLGLSSSF